MPAIPDRCFHNESNAPSRFVALQAEWRIELNTPSARLFALLILQAEDAQKSFFVGPVSVGTLLMKRPMYSDAAETWHEYLSLPAASTKKGDNVEGSHFSILKIGRRSYFASMAGTFNLILCLFND